MKMSACQFLLLYHSSYTLVVVASNSSNVHSHYVFNTNRELKVLAALQAKMVPLEMLAHKGQLDLQESQEILETV